jgi:hypothetical protein
MMRRLDLGEIADQPWCPSAVRDGVRDYLELLGTVARLYEPALPILTRTLERSGSRAVVDLGSGTGGPWRWLHPALERALGTSVHLTLTDRRPTPCALEAWQGPAGERVRVVREPVDARAVDPSLRGVRTLFASFHHFSENDARTVLADAARHAEAVVVVEPTKRALWPVLTMLSSPMPIFALTPLMRPTRAARLALTYLLPVIPLTITYDGVASCLRSYTPDELRELGRSVPPSRLAWEAGEIATKRPPFVPLTYLVGVPR